MKRFMVAATIGLSFLGLTACSASSAPAPTPSKIEESSVPAVQEGIPGAENIKIRWERLQAGGNTFLYCIDSVAYLSLYDTILAAPQYDSLCRTAR